MNHHQITTEEYLKVENSKEWLIVDLFAGGGGTSEGIKGFLGRDPDIAINHDKVALAMHKANHPRSTHYQENVWEVSPQYATKGRPVGLLWASPDCTHFSKAKGGQPKRDLMRRSLAWVVEKWMREVRPRVVVMENVEEFTTWGPLNSEGEIVACQKGTTFTSFIRRIKRLGYHIEWEELRACDYGAPTIRKRFFLIARCDNLPIIWPEPTNGPGLIPYRTAAEIIDWSIPCPSIFERKKPLVENTMRRIAKGIKKYVIDSSDPFIVPIQNYNGSVVAQSINDPLRTITASPKGGGFAIAIPHVQKQYSRSIGQDMDDPVGTVTSKNKTALVSTVVSPYIQRQFGMSVGSGIEEPIGTVTSGGMGKSALVTASMAQHNGGKCPGSRPINVPLSTITTTGSQQQVVTSNLLKLRGTCKDGQPVDHPMPTVTAGGNHVGEVRAFCVKYYGVDGVTGLKEPLHTITTKERFGLVTVMIKGDPYVITDIGMRMLSPRELFRAQGFDDNYIIDIMHEAVIRGKKVIKRITKTDQVRLCGNSVSPPNAKALVESNAGFLHERIASEAS